MINRPRLFGVAIAAAILCSSASAAAASREESARRLVHLLDYIAVDYPATVSEGVVLDAFEYQEQIEFSARAGELIRELGGDPAGVEALAAAIEAREPGAQITERARALSAAARERFGVRLTLAEAPSLERGETLYHAQCASCHGTEGFGDGPAGVGLEPAPSNLREAGRMLSLSPFAVFSTITYGIEGTGMVAYEQTLGESERLDLSFFVARWAHEPSEVAAGARLAEQRPQWAARLAPDLSALLYRAPSAGNPDSDERALLAYLRSAPETLVSGTLPIEIARQRLAESRRAFARGDRDQARALAISAYLDGFEHVEPSVALLDADLRLEVERGLLAYRQALAGAENSGALEAPYTAALALLDRADRTLEGRGLGNRGAFLASLAILTREGLEAILLVAMILAIVARAERPAPRRAVHLGWVTALVAGGFTWWAARGLIEISGAEREIVEGASALVAAAVLFWVSYWLFARLEAERWQAFLAERLQRATAAGSLWILGSLAFLAVYREAFETALFYQALLAQVDAAQHGAVLAGAVVALALLAAAGIAVLRFGRRLPLRPFFAGSSVVLYAFCVMFVGHGIAAFQEAGWIPITPLPLPRVTWLGIYPTLQGLGLQLLLVILALVGVPRLSVARRPVAEGS